MLNREFIVSQSIKKLEGYLKDWALDTDNFLSSIKEDENRIYYKSRKKKCGLNTTFLERNIK